MRAVRYPVGHLWTTEDARALSYLVSSLGRNPGTLRKNKRYIQAYSKLRCSERTQFVSLKKKKENEIHAEGNTVDRIISPTYVAPDRDAPASRLMNPGTRHLHLILPRSLVYRF